MTNPNPHALFQYGTERVKMSFTIMQGRVKILHAKHGVNENKTIRKTMLTKSRHLLEQIVTRKVSSETWIYAVKILLIRYLRRPIVVTQFTSSSLFVEDPLLVKYQNLDAVPSYLHSLCHLNVQEMC